MTRELSKIIRATRVDLREVGMREGFQSHPMILPIKHKVDYFRRLKAAGCREINAVSFVHPGVMPHMADAEEVLRAVADDLVGVEVSGLAPNERGLARAVAMATEGLLQRVFFVFAESLTTLRANGITAGHDELIRLMSGWSDVAHEAGLSVTVFVSTAFGCSIEGQVDPGKVIEHAAQIRTFADEIIISDSAGQADPVQVLELLSDLSDVLPASERIGLHLHDTRGAGLANVVAALSSPFEHLVLDAAFGGWGGDYPFIPEAFGNIATEDLVEMLIGFGITTGVDVESIMSITRDYAAISGRPIGSRMVHASPIAWKREHSASAT